MKPMLKDLFDLCSLPKVLGRPAPGEEVIWSCDERRYPEALHRLGTLRTKQENIWLRYEAGPKENYLHLVRIKHASH